MGKRIGEKILFKETLSLGVAEGDENQIFGGKLYLSVDSDGKIYILDPQNYFLDFLIGKENFSAH